MFVCAIFLVFLCLPITLALLLSSIVYPIIKRTSQLFKLPYSLTILFYTVAGIGFVYFFIITLSASFQPLYTSVFNSIKLFAENVQQDSIAQLALQNIETVLQKVLQYVTSISSQLVQSLFDLFLFTFAFYFSLYECRKDRFWYFIYIPPPYRQKWKHHFESFVQLFSTFITIELRLMLITFIVISTSFYTLQFEQPFLKAFLIAFADLLPFIGIGLIFIPMSIFYFMQDDPTLTIILLLLYVCVLVIRQIAESYFWSAKIKIRTVHSFFISAGAILIFGVYGLLMIPVLFLLAVHFRKKFNDA